MVREDIISLNILFPEKTILQTMVSQVEFPGSKGRFTVLKDHAPLISSLTEGLISYVSNGQKASVSIKSGFVEINANEVSVCAQIKK